MKLSTPLYILAKNKQLGNLQINDLETIKWFKSKAKPTKIYLNEILPSYTPQSRNSVVPYIPHIDWFSQKEHYDSIHGIRHITRVILYSMIIASEFDHTLFDLNDSLICASIHDIKRNDDKADTGHGERAAKWLKKKITLLPKTPYDLDSVLYAISNHETPVELLDIETLSYKNRLLTTLRNADAIDRYRLPKEKWWANKNYLQLGSAISLLDFAKYFVYITELESLGKPDLATKVILKNATDLGIIK